ncbi:MAG: DNA repair protein RecO [Candidatus Nomurabacteria bacterium]|jgi:DNA repair protein RecO (recombination protein O)|nr:DNA repair protein RecO [Candidatus Nomurabacteria bacterium]
MSGSLRTDAIVLRRTNYGEADRILQVITPKNGKLSVMARSVRKEKSRLAGGIELFAVCDIVLHIGKGEIATLTGARLKTFYDQIMTDYDRMQFAYDAIKQVSRASEMIDEPEFFDLLQGCLAALDNLKISLKIVQTWFYLSLAKLLGNELNIATDHNGMKLVEDAQYSFDVGHQVLVFAENGPYNSSHIKLLRVINNNQPEIIARIAGINEIIDDCLRLAQIVAKI